MELKGLKERKRISNGLRKFQTGGDGTNTPGSVGGFYNSNPDINGSISNASGFTGGFVQSGSPQPLHPKEGQYPIDPQVQDYMNNPQTGSPTNGYKAPNSQSPSAAGAGPWFALGEWAGGGVLAGLNAAEIGVGGSSQQMIQNHANQYATNAGTSQGTIGGVSYEQQNLVDERAVKNDQDAYLREAGTSWLTNPFKAATMFIARRSYNKKLERARELANKEAQFKNSYNANTAFSTFLNQQAQTDNNSQMLYAKNGKDCMRCKDGIETSNGPINMYPNALTEDGEVIYNPTKASARVIPGRTKGDKNYSLVESEDVIFTNKYGISKLAMRPAKALYSINKANNKLRGSLGKQTDKFVTERATQQLDKLADIQRNLREVGVLPTNNKQNMLHAASGIESWVPIINSLSNMGGAIGQYINLKREDIKKPNTYRTNPYGAYALQGLNNLRINPYPAIDLAREQERFGRYNINQLGGLSGSQKALANVALSLGTNRSLADLMANIDEKNLAYRNNYYNKAFEFGDRERAAATDAARWDLDYYSKAEAAKRGMMNVAWNNIFTQKDQGLADYLKYRQFLDTYHLYDTGKMK